MPTHLLKRELVLMIAIVAWVGWGTPQALAQRARVPQTGQTQCWDAAGMLTPCAGTGQDGECQAGVPLPTPRFQDNHDGTVTDRLTGLIWLKDTVCLLLPGGYGLTWTAALQQARTLAPPQCGLRDGSVAGDWRLPNTREALSLLDWGFGYPALSNAAGTGQATDGDPFTRPTGQFWTSTTNPVDPTLTFVRDTAEGLLRVMAKTSGAGAWPVRGGQ
jgi:hypothetical protein